MQSFGSSSASPLDFPVRRTAIPADVAPTHIYLTESEFTTGQTINIDGGQRLF
ncbi:NAD(P)-binding domain-containing protein (plasmid) [Rhizobium etli 8C-3]|uniref:NAD(P)-binding domain-containing protein n=1 Tax=Rhizobium etli 8C-3 TaxID=538025 RepID=A0A1L5PHM2_RHIET|nr:NAD(P)-binding domain-containing protein [Rhizobium etli 8C-3]